MVSVGIEVPAGQSRMFHQFRRSGSIPIAHSVNPDDSLEGWIWSNFVDFSSRLWRSKYIAKSTLQVPYGSARRRWEGQMWLESQPQQVDGSCRVGATIPHGRRKQRQISWLSGATRSPESIECGTLPTWMEINGQFGFL
jgi:hypothetical protein